MSKKTKQPNFFLKIFWWLSQQDEDKRTKAVRPKLNEVVKRNSSDKIMFGNQGIPPAIVLRPEITLTSYLSFFRFYRNLALPFDSVPYRPRRQEMQDQNNADDKT